MHARRAILASAGLVVGVLAGMSIAVGQSPAPATQAAPGIKRTIVQKVDVPGTNLETIVAVVEMREKPTKLMAVYVVEKGKPLAAPVK